jgi:hypothetical protein
MAVAGVNRWGHCARTYITDKRQRSEGMSDDEPCLRDSREACAGVQRSQ